MLVVFLKPSFLTLDVGGIKIFVGFYQISNPFDEPDDPHDEWADLDERTEDRYEEHDQAFFGIPEIKFMNPEPAQNDSEYAGRDPALAVDPGAFLD